MRLARHTPRPKPARLTPCTGARLAITGVRLWYTPSLRPVQILSQWGQTARARPVHVLCTSRYVPCRYSANGARRPVHVPCTSRADTQPMGPDALRPCACSHGTRAGCAVGPPCRVRALLRSNSLRADSPRFRTAAERGEAHSECTAARRNACPKGPTGGNAS
jgi:hypothetical protein